MQNKERKYEILYSIIKDYINSGEPVGSRTIEKKYNLGISSATIRNEMSDLEEMGYLIQPHASAGRIPSDKAYRMYVDQFMHVFDLDDEITEQVRKQYREYWGELNAAVRKTSEILTKITNYTSLVMVPGIASLNIKDVRLIHIENERVLLVLITKQGIVKNAELKLAGKATSAQLEKITNFLNLCIKDIETEMTVSGFGEKVESLDSGEQKILAEVVPAIKYVLNQDLNEKMYATGLTEIFNYPEFQNMNKARQLLDALHKQDMLSLLLQNALDDTVNIRIGAENEMEEMNDCSILTATYRLNGNPIGTIGILGPTRMNYDYCVSALNALAKELTNHISSSIGGHE